MNPPLRLAALAACLLSLAGCSRDAAPVHEDVRPVRSIVVGRSDGSVGASYAGTVQARYESKLGFQTGGRIVARLVEVGTPVRRGQPLMRLDPAQETLQAVAAGADVEAARSRVAKLELDVQRTQQLLARSYATQAELDQQQLALDEARAHLTSALAHQQIKLNQRGYTELRADRDGVVTTIVAEAGQVVSPGQAVLTLAADGEREVVVSIPESRVDELRQARALQVAVWAHPDRRWRGTLRELAPDADSVARTYAARISIHEPGAALRLGMTATVTAHDIAGTSAIRVPLTAVLHGDGGARVWVVDTTTSRVSPRQVELGAAHDDQVIVTAGLAGGETVVSAGVHHLHDGQKVKAAGANTAVVAAGQGAAR